MICIDLMIEIQRLGDVLLGARRKSLLEVIATTGGLATTVAEVLDSFSGTPIVSSLSGIAQTALDLERPRPCYSSRPYASGLRECTDSG